MISRFTKLLTTSLSFRNFSLNLYLSRLNKNQQLLVFTPVHYVVTYFPVFCNATCIKGKMKLLRKAGVMTADYAVFLFALLCEWCILYRNELENEDVCNSEVWIPMIAGMSGHRKPMRNSDRHRSLITEETRKQCKLLLCLSVVISCCEISEDVVTASISLLLNFSLISVSFSAIDMAAYL